EGEKMKSWRTTLAGIAAVVAVLSGAVAAQFDADPTTVPNWELVWATLFAALGLAFARDNDKSSEDVGAR
ncbi:unnamed protein product, partial [marine sediment metagenome]